MQDVFPPVEVGDLFLDVLEEPALGRGVVVGDGGKGVLDLELVLVLRDVVEPVAGGADAGFQVAGLCLGGLAAQAIADGGMEIDVGDLEEGGDELEGDGGVGEGGGVLMEGEDGIGFGEAQEGDVLGCGGVVEESIEETVVFVEGFEHVRAVGGEVDGLFGFGADHEEAQDLGREEVGHVPR